MLYGLVSCRPVVLLSPHKSLELTAEEWNHGILRAAEAVCLVRNYKIQDLTYRNMPIELRPNSQELWNLTGRNPET